MEWERIGAMEKGGDWRTPKAVALSHPALVIISPLWADWSRLQSPSGLLDGRNNLHFFTVLIKRFHWASERDIRGCWHLNKTHEHTPEKLPPFKRSTMPNYHMTVSITSHTLSFRLLMLSHLKMKHMRVKMFIVGKLAKHLLLVYQVVLRNYRVI